MIQDKNQKRTEISELGEFGLIEHLTKDFSIKNSTTIKGIGDDAAVLDYTDKKTLISTDLLVEGVHFDLSYMPLKHLGYKAVIVNLSDIYAMNALAEQVTLSIAVSNRFNTQDLEDLYQGVSLACKIYGVDLIGGDTSSSQKGMLMSLTAIGGALKEDIVYRNGAKPNDLIVITGDIGAAYLGYQILEREKQVFKENINHKPDLDQYTYLIERQLKPEARIDIPKMLKKLGVKPTSMIDISDGLSSEIIHICRSSKVGAQIFENKLPLDPQVISTCEEFNMDSTTIALNAGEDYELVFTISQSDFDKIKGNPNLTVIGYVTEEKSGVQLVTRANQQIEMTAQGWNSLLESEKANNTKKK